MKKLSKLLAVVTAFAMLFVFTACSGDNSSNNDSGNSATYTIGIIQYMEHDALDQATEGFRDYLTEKLGDSVTFDYDNAQGEQTNCGTIVTKFVSDGVDLIMANATPAVQAAREATSTIPIIGTSVTDYVESGLIESDDAPGGNVTGASDLNPVDVQVELMQALCPDVQTVGIVYCSAEANSEIQANEATAAFEAAGYTVRTYTAADSNELQSVFTQACTEVDAFYEPTDNLIANNMELVRNITVPAGKPVICGEESMCLTGGLATYSISYYDLGYAAGEQAYNILVNGADPATTPIYHFSTSDLTLVVNEEVAGELNIEIPADLQ